MPSASSAKIDKQQSSSASGEVADNSSPIRQVLVIIEHKIRNLEKRKGKLESYRDIEKSGKELSSDQKIAVSKYNEVAQTLEFAREFCKQIIQIATLSEKELKKKQKKDETLKKQNETAKIREVLVIQDVLRLLAEEGARENFLNGTNGACKLEESDFELLDKFSEEISPKRPTAADEVPFTHAAQKSADHLAFTIDSKPKAFGEGTYADIRSIFRNIQKSGYFDKALLLPAAEEEVPVEDASNADEKIDANSQKSSEQDGVKAENKKPETQDFQEAPAATAVPVPTFPPQQIVPVQPTQIVQPIPIVQPMVPVVGITNVAAPAVAIPPTNQIHPTHMQPTTVRAVEQAYFKQHQYIQQIRPLAEVIGTGNFFFLQDSELDSPDIMPAFPQPPSNPQISPTPQPQNQPLATPQQQAQHQQQQQPPPPLQQPQQQTTNPTQVLQQQQTPQQQPPVMSAAPQIPSHTFTNQTFSNIVPTQIFAGIKPADVSQAHIPGFATPNAPIPIPLVQSAPVAPQPQVPQSSLIQNQPSAQILAGQTSSIGGIGSFSAGKLAAPILPNDLTSQIKPQSPPKEARNTVADVKPVRESEQRVPEITEWKAEDAVKPLHEEITEWRDPYENTEVSDWNEDAQDDSNTWSSNHRYNYRGHQNNYNNNGRNNRGPPRSGANNPTNGYRGRSTNSYNPNGRQSGGNSGNTFYRNNDNYYHNQNGTGGYRGSGGDSTKDVGYRGDGSKQQDGGGGGGGVYRGGDKQENNFRNDKQEGGYRDNKPDGGYRGGGNFRSRETRDHNNGSIRGGPRNNRNNSDSAERGNQSSIQRGPGSMQNANNRNPTLASGAGGGGGGGTGTSGGNGGNPRSSSKGQLYGANSRVTGGNSRPQTSVNV